MPYAEPAHIPYPAGNAAPAAAADMMALAVSLGAKVVLYATDAADRDARYSAVPAGSFVVSATLGAAWIKKTTGLAQWVTVYADTGWVTTGFVPDTGWTLSTTPCMARQVGAVIEVRCGFTRTGVTLTPNGTGGMNDIRVATIPAAFGPSQTLTGTHRSTNGSGGAYLTTGGGLWLTDMHPGSTIDPGDGIVYGQTYLAG